MLTLTLTLTLTLSIVNLYKPLRKHPALFDAKAGWNRWIEPRLLDALEELKAGNESAVRSLLRVEVEGSDASVYSFAIFTTDFCDRFIEELDNYYATGLPQPRPNSMNNYGIIVNQIGMQACPAILTTITCVLWHAGVPSTYPLLCLLWSRR